MYNDFGENYYDIFIRTHNGTDISFSTKLPLCEFTNDILVLFVKILELKLKFKNLDYDEIQIKLNSIKKIMYQLDENLIKYMELMDSDDSDIIKSFLFYSEPDFTKKIKGKIF